MDNILKYLEKTAERFPDKTAVDDGTVQFTYQELLDKGGFYAELYNSQFEQAS